MTSEEVKYTTNQYGNSLLKYTKTDYTTFTVDNKIYSLERRVDTEDGKVSKRQELEDGWWGRRRRMNGKWFKICGPEKSKSEAMQELRKRVRGER